MTCSRWSASPARTISMGRISPAFIRPSKARRTVRLTKSGSNGAINAGARRSASERRRRCSCRPLSAEASEILPDELLEGLAALGSQDESTNPTPGPFIPGPRQISPRGRVPTSSDKHFRFGSPAYRAVPNQDPRRANRTRRGQPTTNQHSRRQSVCEKIFPPHSQEPLSHPLKQNGPA
jgi:hypothetical protein